jgi:6-phosphogluconate dehydrogenase
MVKAGEGTDAVIDELVPLLDEGDIVVDAGIDASRRVVSAATATGVPVPALATSLSYFDALRRDRLPAALIQGLRDFFGAHTYGRIDREGTFHTAWAGDRAESAAG